MSTLQKIWKLSYSWKHVVFAVLIIIWCSTTSTRLFPIKHYEEEKLNPIYTIILHSQNYAESEALLVKQFESKPQDRDAWLQYINFRSHKLSHENHTNKFQLTQPYLSENQFAIFVHNKAPAHSDLLLSYYHFRLKRDSIHLAEIKAIADSPGDNLRRAEAYELYSMMLAFNQSPSALIAEAIKNAIAFNPANEGLKVRYLRFLQSKNLHQELEQVLDEPAFEKHIDSSILIKHAISERDWAQFFKHGILNLVQGYEWASSLLCLVSGLGWFVLFVKITGFSKALNIDKCALVLALILGFFSTWACILIIHIQDFFIFTTPTHELSPPKLFVFYTAGVGLREEFSKLLLLLPLVPWLAKSRDPLKHLLFAAIVGLGFAIEENILYLVRHAHEPGLLFGRFVTANFFHMMLSSYCGYYFIRAWRLGGRAWNDFAINFCKMILLHGAYDFFLTVNFEGAYFIAMMLYVATGYEFLQLLLSFTRHNNGGPSATSLLMIALAASAGAGIYYSGSLVGLGVAFEAIIPTILANAVLAYMFVKAFNDPMR